MLFFIFWNTAFCVAYSSSNVSVEPAITCKKLTNQTFNFLQEEISAPSSDKLKLFAMISTVFFNPFRPFRFALMGITAPEFVPAINIYSMFAALPLMMRKVDSFMLFASKCSFIPFQHLYCCPSLLSTNNTHYLFAQPAALFILFYFTLT